VRSKNIFFYFVKTLPFSMARIMYQQLAKNGSGSTSGRFFTNSSAHPCKPPQKLSPHVVRLDLVRVIRHVNGGRFRISPFAASAPGGPQVPCPTRSFPVVQAVAGFAD
jgi:hypothetical protein